MAQVPRLLRPFCVFIFVLQIFAYAQNSKKQTAVVQYATIDEVFFNLGTEDGVIPNQPISIKRGQRNIGNCVLQEVSLHQSLCKVAFAKAFDTAEIMISAKPNSENKPNQAFVFTPIQEAEKRNSMISRGLLNKAPFTKKNGIDATSDSVSYHAGIEHETWYQSKSSNGNYSRESIELSLQDFTVFGNIKANIDTSTWIWSKRPVESRFRPQKNTQFYVWEAAISSHQSEKGLEFDLGRVRPRHIPGIVSIDGVSADYAFSSFSQVGVFAGYLPDLITMHPSTDSWAAGLFSNYRAVLGENVLYRQQVRLGPKHSIDLKTRMELQAQMNFDLFKRINVWSDLLLGSAGNTDKGVDAFRGGLFLRPTDKVTASLQTRILNRQTTEGTDPILQGSKHYDGDIAFQITNNLTLSTLAGRSIQKSGEALKRSYVGGDFRIHQILCNSCSMQGGYQEDFGWFTGRQVYLTPQWTSHAGSRASLRSSVSQNIRNSKTSNELGFGGSFQMPLGNWLWMKMNSMIQIGDIIPMGLFASLGLEGPI